MAVQRGRFSKETQADVIGGSKDKKKTSIITRDETSVNVSLISSGWRELREKTGCGIDAELDFVRGRQRAKICQSSVPLKTTKNRSEIW